MDGMDSFIFSLVLVPALRDVLPSSGIAATTANVGYYSGLLFALFMVGWGVALVWGPIADRFGRARTFMFSILWFSLFTLLAGLCHNVWSLAIVRFMAGVGIGGEWSIGASLVSEEWPETTPHLGRMSDAHRLLHRLRDRSHRQLFHRQPIRLEMDVCGGRRAGHTGSLLL